MIETLINEVYNTQFMKGKIQMISKLCNIENI